MDARTSSTPTESVEPTTVAIDQQMQRVLELMEARTRGVATNEEVEAAVSSMLVQQPMSSSTPKLAASKTFDPPIAATAPSVDQPGQADMVPRTARKRSQQEIQPDLEDYNEETNETLPTNNVATADTVATNQSLTLAASPETVPPTKRPRGRPRKRDSLNVAGGASTPAAIPPTDWTAYEDIPLGKQGAQMMTTFGDGKNPVPAAVAATLQGARLMLQTAIQDARHVRRKQKAIYKSAKESIQAAKQQKPTLKEEWSTEILFRAAQGYDSLSYDPKCGFGIEEIQKLFPEEINAYNRWNEMHSNATEDEKTVVDEDGAAEPSTLDAPVVETAPSSDVIGHLNERACQFDLRTTQMHGDWYLKYAVLRQGSFLPRRTKSTMGVDAEWETARKLNKSKKQRGSHGAAGVWAHMSAPYVRFLHWLGFDPTSALPPPNDDVTGALAFLGHDFFGRIVEKAILLRQLDRQKQQPANGTLEATDGVMLIELAPGEQLTEDEIAKAMEDPDIKPVPLYSGASNKKLGPQLYFGPGFEDRLEMEMDEMMWSSQNSTTAVIEDELKIRQQEDELFSQIAQPPTRDGILELLRAPKE